MIGVYVRARRAHFHSAASDCGLGGDGRSVMPLSQPCVLLAHCVARLGPLCAFLRAVCYVLLKSWLSQNRLGAACGTLSLLTA